MVSSHLLGTEAIRRSIVRWSVLYHSRDRMANFSSAFRARMPLNRLSRSSHKYSIGFKSGIAKIMEGRSLFPPWTTSALWQICACGHYPAGIFIQWGFFFLEKEACASPISPCTYWRPCVHQYAQGDRRQMHWNIPIQWQIHHRAWRWAFGILGRIWYSSDLESTVSHHFQTY